MIWCFVGDARIYIMGHPKSGNNLLCYSLANILKKPVIYNINKPKVYAYPNELDHVVEFSSEEILANIGYDTIFFEHHSYGLGLHQANQNDEFLVVIVRDYHECFTRVEIQMVNGGPFSPEFSLNKVKNLRPLNSIEDCYNTNAIDLINILRCYDQWNPKTRILIYYEDLLTNFEFEMRKCLNKLHVPEHLLTDFLSHKEERLQESLNTYRYGKTMSGNDLKYYQHHWLTPEISIRMDQEIKMRFPYFWKKYLKRYRYCP